jgi:hypothetical protein
MLSVTYQHTTKQISTQNSPQTLKLKIKELFDLQKDFEIIQQNNSILVMDSTVQQDLKLFMNTEQEFQSFSTKLKLFTK